MTDSPPPEHLEAARAYRELQRKARDQGRTTEELLVLYLLEAFLRRLSVSAHRTRFVLKGGVLLSALGDRRPTRDIGFQARQIAMEHDQVQSAICEIASTDLGDGVLFDVSSATAEVIREDDGYRGLRV